MVVGVDLEAEELLDALRVVLFVAAEDERLGTLREGDIEAGR